MTILRDPNGPDGCAQTPPWIETYTYTIFDADPSQVAGTEWPLRTRVPLTADSAREAEDLVRDVLYVEANRCCDPADGYQVGQSLYALIWNSDDVVVGQVEYMLTATDLDLD